MSSVFMVRIGGQLQPKGFWAKHDAQESVRLTYQAVPSRLVEHGEAWIDADTGEAITIELVPLYTTPDRF